MSAQRVPQSDIPNGQPFESRPTAETDAQQTFAGVAGGEAEVGAQSGGEGKYPSGAGIPSFRSNPAMLYPTSYVWIVFFSAMDVMLTWMILYWLEGSEINPVAVSIINHWGMIGATLFKFGLVVTAIIICEMVGRRHRVKGKRLALVLVLIAAFPVVWSLTLLLTSAGEIKVTEPTEFSLVQPTEARNSAALRF